jgi:NodT family efflux transporter outer membrane factor (OMF) lipoprotein
LQSQTITCDSNALQGSEIVKGRVLIGSGAALLCLSACAVGPDYKSSATVVPAHYVADMSGKAASAPPAQADLTQWWKSFRDPELDSLVARAIAANPDIAIALTRLQEARAQELVVIGSTLPSGEASAGAGLGTGSDNTRGRISQTLHSAADTSGLTHINEAGGFDAAWEVDIFGKLRREVEAATFDAQAAAKARDAVLVSVVANVARAYIDLRSFQAQLAVARKNVEAAQRSLQLAQTRFNQGLTNELDVTLANRQLATFQAGLGPLTIQIEGSQYIIAELLGLFPESLAQELAAPKPFPSFPAKIPTGIPVSLLRRRPDIQELELQAGAATARQGSAIADLFPRVAITGALGGQGGVASAGGNPITFIGGIGPALYWPVLDFGTLDAQIEVADLKTKEALQHYRFSILTAVREVDDAISTYRGEQSRLADLSRARAAALQAVQLSSERYERGLTDFLNVLDAERQRFEIEAQYVIAQQNAGDEIVSLYKALGGGWEHEQAVPSLRSPEPAVIAAARLIGQPEGPHPVP